MLTVTFTAAQLASLSNLYAAAGQAAPTGISRALNHTTKKCRTQMVRQIVPQTGLKYGTIRKALKSSYSTPGTLTAAIYSKGGDISLKFFKPKEGGGGVTAKPRGQSLFVAQGFLTSGRPGNRAMSRKLGGHVYTNAEGGKWRGKITKARSGVIIPEEMVTGASEQAFHSVAQRDLGARMAHELLRLL